MIMTCKPGDYVTVTVDHITRSGVVVDVLSRQFTYQEIIDPDYYLEHTSIIRYAHYTDQWRITK